jgi:hypothetical protein
VAELSLPERLVHAAEKAIEEARVCGEFHADGTRTVEGHVTDFAKAAVAAALEAWADGLSNEGYVFSSASRRKLARQVRDVPALEGT